MGITTRNQAFQNRAKGLGVRFPIFSTGTTGTLAAAGSGFINGCLLFNAIGSTTPVTLVGFPFPSGLSNELYPSYKHYQNGIAGGRSVYQCILYKLGTLDLANAAATPYDGFTHNANFTGPITRTICGQSTNVQMVPVFYLTVITATSAPAFILQATTGPGNGYKNQANSNVIGTKTFTLPSATTAAASTYILRLEDGDSAITDMTQISVTTKSTGTAAATIFGAEFLMCSTSDTGISGISDPMFGGLCMSDMNVGTPTTGTLTRDTDYFHAEIMLSTSTVTGSGSPIVMTLNA